MACPSARSSAALDRPRLSVRGFRASGVRRPDAAFAPAVFFFVSSRPKCWHKKPLSICHSERSEESRRARVRGEKPSLWSAAARRRLVDRAFGRDIHRSVGASITLRRVAQSFPFSRPCARTPLCAGSAPLTFPNEPASRQMQLFLPNLQLPRFNHRSEF